MVFFSYCFVGRAGTYWYHREPFEYPAPLMFQS